MEGGGGLTAYEQERQRRLEENRRKLEEMGLQQVRARVNTFERGLERGRRPHACNLVACRSAMQRAQAPQVPPPARRRRWATPAGADSPAWLTPGPLLVLCPPRRW